MKSILAAMTIVLGLLSVAPAIAGPTDTGNAAQSKMVFDRVGGTSGG